MINEKWRLEQVQHYQQAEKEHILKLGKIAESLAITNVNRSTNA